MNELSSLLACMYIEFFFLFLKNDSKNSSFLIMILDKLKGLL